MGRRALLVLLLLAACTKKNPLYCDREVPCPGGMRCLLTERECVPEGAGVPDLADGRDAAPPDLVPPAECSAPAQCPAARPACVAGRCQPCTRNHQCPAGACDEGGTCHDQAKIIVVDDTPGACRRAGEPPDRPYCYVSEALRDGDLGRTKDLVLILPSTRGGHWLDGGYLEVKESVRLVGRRQGAQDPPVFVREPVYMGAAKEIQVSVEDLHLGGFTGAVNGILCDGKYGGPRISLTVRHSRIQGAPNSGLLAQFCAKVQLLSSQFIGNATDRTTNASGVYIGGGDVTILNSVIAQNGQGSLSGGGLYLLSLDRATVALNTITGNSCTAVGASPTGCNLYCDGNYTVTVSHSILTGAPAGKKSIDGVCSVRSSAVPQGFTGGSENIVGVTPTFVNEALGDYHLDPAAPDNRMLRLSEPTPPAPVDIDDDPRPAGAVDVGADQIR